jgi:hypothetical protein
MTKLIRKHQKVFAKDANSNELSIFGSLKAGIPAYSNDPDNIQSAEYLRGLFGAVIGDNSPAIEDHNSLFYLFSRQLAYLFQQGIAEWDSATEYHTGSLCSLSTEVGKIYVSRTDTNVNHSPTGTNWQLYWYVFDLNKLEKYTPFCVNSGRTDAGYASLVSYSGNILTFLVGGSYPNLVVTTAKGITRTYTTLPDVDFSSDAQGVWHTVLISPDGTLTKTDKRIFRRNYIPIAITLKVGDMRYDTSVKPSKAEIWNGTIWEETDMVPLVRVYKGASIVATETLPYNYNGDGIKLVASSGKDDNSGWYEAYYKVNNAGDNIILWIRQGGKYASDTVGSNVLVPLNVGMAAGYSVDIQLTKGGGTRNVAVVGRLGYGFNIDISSGEMDASHPILWIAEGQSMTYFTLLNTDLN